MDRASDLCLVIRWELQRSTSWVNRYPTFLFMLRASQIYTASLIHITHLSRYGYVIMHPEWSDSL